MMDKNRETKFFTVAELAKILGITRAAVHKKIQAGKIATIRIGRAYAIPASSLPEILRTQLGEGRKKEIDEVVRRVVTEYGDTIRLLGKE